MLFNYITMHGAKNIKSINSVSNDKLKMKCVKVICKTMGVFWLSLFADYILNCMGVEFVFSCQ